MTLLETFNMKHNLGIICLLETYYDFSIQHDEARLHLSGYQLAKAGNPHNNKRGGVGAYFKEFLVTWQLELHNLNKCLMFEVCIRNKKGYVISLHRSPTQPHDEFGNFLLTFKQVLCDNISRSPIFVLITGHFNARAAKWWRNVMTTNESTNIDSVTTSYGF